MADSKDDGETIADNDPRAEGVGAVPAAAT